MNLKGKHLLCTQDWSLEDLELVLQLADDMRLNRFDSRFTSILQHKTFFMFFYNPSVRTRQSFECAAIELGGAAQFLEPKSMRLKTKKSAGETVEDAAQVMARYAVGLGIRILEDKIDRYGQGQELLEEYAKWSTIPVVSMAHDKFHPCQGLADVLGYRTHLGNNLKGKKLLQVWGHGALARSWCSVQESLLINSRFGMDVTLAYPEGYDLDPEVIEQTRKNCEANGQKFEITHEPVDCYDGADIVYSRNWMSPKAYGPEGFDKTWDVEEALKHTQWITDTEKMKRTNNAVYSHPMPIDRGHEVSDDVASGPRSIIYDIAENRLHVQKAYMALSMSDFNYELKECKDGQKTSCGCNRR
ncbi:MAG: ornithine carbamoyltransferase [Cyanobacteriota bacterium]